MAIRQMTYQHPATVETMPFARLRELNDGGTQRADFHVLAIVDTGPGTVTIDFHQHPLTDRSAVWIPPGAVHRWDDITTVIGTVVLFTPTAPITPATRQLASTPAHWRVPDWPYVDAARNHLLLEATHEELPQILLSALLTRLRPPHADPHPTNPTFDRFRAAVETHFRQHHDTTYYTQTLGYSPRTLSRATQQATGRTAKAYIVDRLTLEAKRLLAHDRLPATHCGRLLGFPDPSNFSLFFRQATGTTPGAWQASA